MMERVRPPGIRPARTVPSVEDVGEQRGLAELLDKARLFSERLGGSPARDESLRAALGVLRRIEGVEALAVYTLDDVAGRLALIANVDLPADFAALRLEHPLAIEEADAILRHLPSFAPFAGPVAQLAPCGRFVGGVFLPVRHAGAALGCLYVALGANAPGAGVLAVLGSAALQIGAVLERTRAEAALRAREIAERQQSRLVRLMCDNVPELIWAKDLCNNYLFANRALCEKLLCAHDTDEPVGRNDLFFAERERRAHPEHPAWHTFGDICSDSDNVVLSLGEGRRFDEYGTVRGQFLYLDVYKTPLRDDDGHVIGTVGCARDVTRERRIEQELRVGIEQKQYLVQNMPAMVVAFDPAGAVLAWNAECERVTGWPAGEIVSDPGALDALFPGDAAQRVLEELRHPSAEFRGRESTLLAKDGAERTIAWSTIARRFPVPGWYAWALGIDVTAARRAQDERQRLEARLQHAQRLESLGALAGGIAHDFNNLLTGILGNSEIALLELAPDSPVRDSVRRIGEAAQRATDLTGQLMAYSGHGVSVPERLDLGRIVQDAEPRLAALVPESATLELAPSGRGPLIDVDRTQLRQALAGLVANAGEALGPGPGRIAVRTARVEGASVPRAQLVFGELRDAPYALLEVTDDGCGMDECVRARILDPFFSTKRGARGLGLVPVLGLARAHDGAILVESAAGRGTRVALLLPHAAAPAEVREPPPPPAPWRGSGTILVVDDEELIRYVARRLVTKLGFDVVLAANGREGVEAFRAAAGRVRAVLLDLTMPVMDGAAALREIHRIDPQVPILLTSGFNQAEALARFGVHDWSGFLHKPFLPEQLADALRRVLEPA